MKLFQLLRKSVSLIVICLIWGVLFPLQTVNAVEVCDTLTRDLTGIANGATSYAEWSGKTAHSDAVYAGQSAGSNNSIQLRSNNSNSGVVTTTSGGTVKSITVKFNSNTADARVLNIYASNSAYTAATDLYNSSKAGTKVTSFTKSNGATQSYTFTEEYAYIGIRSNSGALYLDEVDVVWEVAGEIAATAIELDHSSLDLTVGDVASLVPTLTPANASTAVTWESSNPSVARVENGTVSALAAGTVTITASAGTDVSATCEVTVNEPVAEKSVVLKTDKSTALINEAVTFSYTPIGMENPQLAGLYYRFKGDDEYILSESMSVRFDEAGTFEIYARVQDGADYYNSAVVEVLVKTAGADATPSGGEKSYLHVFSAFEFPNGQAELSGVKWDISAGSWTNFNYDNGYKGLQLGYSGMTSPKTFTFTTHSAWGDEANDYSELKTIKSINLWLSNGKNSSISAVVTINGEEVACSGNCTVTRTTNVASYLNQSMLTFIPEEGNNEGVIEIQLTTNTKISYFCAIRIDCEGDITPATVRCVPAANEVYKGMPLSFDFELENASDGEFMYLTYWKEGEESNKEYQSLPSISFAEAGTYQVAVTVNSNKGQVTSAPVSVVVNERAAGSWLVTFKDYDGTVLSTQLVQNGEAAEAPTNFGRSGYRFTGWDGDISNITADVVFTAQYSAVVMNYQTTSYDVKLPAAALFYDFNGDGKLQAIDYNYDVYTPYNYAPNQLVVLSDITGSFAAERTQSSLYYPMYVEDVDRDGQMEIGTYYKNSNLVTLFGNGVEDDISVNSLAVPNLDINGDGRLDMISYSNTGRITWYEQLSTGGFAEREEDVYTFSSYMAQFNEATWQQTTHEKQSSGGFRNNPNHGYISGVTFIGAALARAPQVRKAPGMGTSIALPTKAIDMNADGFIDLVDERQGIVYFNMGDDKWVYEEIATTVIPVDLNGDGFTDFLFPGDQLKASIYDGNGGFTTSTLFNNAAVDPTVYCRDFDKDGDVDILLTVSACWNQTNRTDYVLILKNDGNGNFTKAGNTQSFPDYMQFSNLADIDGDGYYDLLAFRGTSEQTYSYTSFATGNLEVVVLRGKNDLTFEAPENLYTVDNKQVWVNTRIDNSTTYNVYRRINAEDLNGDGIPEIWLSDVDTYTTNFLTGTRYPSVLVASNLTGTAPARPVAPAQPILTYDDGFVTITWGDGEDANCSVADLTYALRIGTTPGGNEILRAHANADGTRRNFLDGNMGKLHSYTIDLRTYPSMDIYVSVQTVNAAHRGSAWSAEATMHYGYINNNFSLNRTNYTLGEQVIATYTPMPAGYTRTFDIGDGTPVSQDEAAGTAVFTFASQGNKTISMTLTTPDNETASSEKAIVVLPNSIGEITGFSGDYQITGMFGYSTYDMSKNNIIADYNFDGKLDGTYNSKIYDGNANMASLSASTGFWNTNLAFARGMFYDWNHDGYFDLVYRTNTITDGRVLAHNGTDDFVEDYTSISAVSDIFRNSTNNYVDFTHSGYPEFFLEGNVSIFENGAYTAHEVDASQQTLVKNIALCDRHVDWNHDGFMDVVGLYAEPAYNYLGLLLNNGDGTFAVQTIPFAQSIASATNGNNDMNRWQMADMDNDGYYDIVAQRYAGDIYILWNEQNESFSAPQLLAKGDDVIDHGDVTGNDAYRHLMVSDIDNDGHKDIVTLAYSTDKEYGFYAYYMGAARAVRTQGFLTRNSNLSYFSNGGTQIVNMWADAPRIFSSISLEWIPVTGATNAAPSAPTNLRATQTAEGLLIEWDAAEDDHTPANQIRYNLSVSRRGQTGEGAYVISPQNGAQNGTVYMPDYAYTEATRFLVPMKYLTDGTYNIRVQALDGWNQLSPFSSQLKATIDASASVNAPASVCVGANATIAYTGTAQTGTPAWDFNGGTIVSGTGFGPYTVAWNTPGTKTVSITTNGLSASAEIFVEAVESGVELPAIVFDNTTVTLDIPEGCTTQWTIPGKPATLWYEANSLSFNGVGSSTWDVTLTITNAHGCTETIQQTIRVLTQDEMPAVTIVETNADNHHRIAFTADPTLFPEVQVLRETNVANEFEVLATLDATLGEFVDESSNAALRAERYAVAGVMANGTVSPASEVHRTIHLTINRSLYDATYNLIWNAYEGAEVVTYNILRGATPSTLQQVASLSAINTSYTDVTPDAALPYYAIEFVLNAPASAPLHRAPQKMAATLVGRSNVVNSLETATGVENIQTGAEGAAKLLIDGHILILRGERAYTVTGQEVR